MTTVVGSEAGTKYHNTTVDCHLSSGGQRTRAHDCACIEEDRERRERDGGRDEVRWKAGEDCYKTDKTPSCGILTARLLQFERLSVTNPNRIWQHALYGPLFLYRHRLPCI
jgi:hypothetical protein